MSRAKRSSCGTTKPSKKARVDGADEPRSHVTFAEYIKLAEAGDKEAQFVVGRLLFRGKRKGVSRDFIQAARWFQRSADQNHVRAQCFLGICFRFGRGVPKDMSEAIKWFTLAADAGDTKAKDKLSEMSKCDGWYLM